MGSAGGFRARLKCSWVPDVPLGEVKSAGRDPAPAGAVALWDLTATEMRTQLRVGVCIQELDPTPGALASPEGWDRRSFHLRLPFLTPRAPANPCFVEDAPVSSSAGVIKLRKDL